LRKGTKRKGTPQETAWIELPRDRLHTLGSQPTGIGKHRQRIAAKDVLGEHIRRVETITH